MYRAYTNKAIEVILISDGAHFTIKFYQEYRRTLCDQRKEGLIIWKSIIPAKR